MGELPSLNDIGPYYLKPMAVPPQRHWCIYLPLPDGMHQVAKLLDRDYFDQRMAELVRDAMNAAYYEGLGDGQTEAKEQLAQLSAQVERLRALVPQWRPIETAPKDVRWLLLWWPALLNAPLIGYHSVGGWADQANDHCEGDQIVDPEDGEVIYESLPAPTHWVPLPPPHVETHIAFTSPADQSAWDECQGERAGEGGEDSDHG